MLPHASQTKDNHLRTISATEQKGVMTHSVVWLTAEITTFHSARDGYLNLGSVRFP